MNEFLEELGVDQKSLRWEDLALCQNSPIDWFFKDYETDTTHAQQVDEMCLACPVSGACFKKGSGNESGVWGGFYLEKGKIDKARNAHKTSETESALKRKIAEYEGN